MLHGNKAITPRVAVKEYTMETMFTAPNFLSPEFFGAFDGFRKTSTEHAKRLESINLKLGETLMKKQAEIINQAVETSTRVAALFSEGKALPEIMSEQFRIHNEYGTRMFGLMQETGNAVVDSQTGYREWMEQGYKEFSEQFKGIAVDFTPVGGKSSRKA
jgi:hypothetical protein